MEAPKRCRWTRVQCRERREDSAEGWVQVSGSRVAMEVAMKVVKVRGWWRWRVKSSKVEGRVEGRRRVDGDGDERWVRKKGLAV